MNWCLYLSSIFKILSNIVILKFSYYVYTGISVTGLFGYQDPPFSESLSEQISSELFGYRDKGWEYRYPNRGQKAIKYRKLIEGLEGLSMESLKTYAEPL